MSQNKTLSEQKALEKIQFLVEKTKTVNERIIQLKTLKQQNDEDLLLVKKEAEDEFGTSDLAEMRIIYQNRISQQSKNVLSFEKDVEDISLLINQIDQELIAIDQKYSK